MNGGFAGMVLGLDWIVLCIQVPAHSLELMQGGVVGRALHRAFKLRQRPTARVRNTLASRVCAKNSGTRFARGNQRLESAVPNPDSDEQKGAGTTVRIKVQAELSRC